MIAKWCQFYLHFPARTVLFFQDGTIFNLYLEDTVLVGGTLPYKGTVLVLGALLQQGRQKGYLQADLGSLLQQGRENGYLQAA